MLASARQHNHIYRALELARHERQMRHISPYVDTNTPRTLHINAYIRNSSKERIMPHHERYLLQRANRTFHKRLQVLHARPFASSTFRFRMHCELFNRLNAHTKACYDQRRFKQRRIEVAENKRQKAARAVMTSKLDHRRMTQDWEEKQQWKGIMSRWRDKRIQEQFTEVFTATSSASAMSSATLRSIHKRAAVRNRQGKFQLDDASLNVERTLQSSAFQPFVPSHPDGDASGVDGHDEIQTATNTDVKQAVSSSSSSPSSSALNSLALADTQATFALDVNESVFSPHVQRSIASTSSQQQEQQPQQQQQHVADGSNDEPNDYHSDDFHTNDANHVLIARDGASSVPSELPPPTSASMTIAPAFPLLSSVFLSTATSSTPAPSTSASSSSSSFASTHGGSSDGAHARSRLHSASAANGAQPPALPPHNPLSPSAGSPSSSSDILFTSENGVRGITTSSTSVSSLALHSHNTQPVLNMVRVRYTKSKAGGGSVDPARGSPPHASTSLSASTSCDSLASTSSSAITQLPSSRPSSGDAMGAHGRFGCVSGDAVAGSKNVRQGASHTAMQERSHSGTRGWSTRSPERGGTAAEANGTRVNVSAPIPVRAYGERDEEDHLDEKVCLSTSISLYHLRTLFGRSSSSSTNVARSSTVSAAASSSSSHSRPMSSANRSASSNSSAAVFGALSTSASSASLAESSPMRKPRQLPSIGKTRSTQLVV